MTASTWARIVSSSPWTRRILVGDSFFNETRNWPERMDFEKFLFLDRFRTWILTSVLVFRFCVYIKKR
ncbi:uncharacterized protein OCT59_001107 [Rhizophagus irregularis]|uniref:Uncharacterized protein n=1 Tax=Rhizophagus irregularis TaxID=588596 RepID=A0A916E3N3_9GLOM|nr:hypothetical protein OCT59_001107 [Rhizophagus irregularis]CAB4485505.1 unnamed protein product [Rhizophagus irregularis]CAB5356638.1 unnamed protein product [Rhizophagus irregularis]